MVYLDDNLITHPKLAAAAATLGEHGLARALAMFVAGLAYSTRHLTDGFIPNAFLTTNPIEPGGENGSKDVAKALAKQNCGLWKRVQGGFQIHDFHDWNRTSNEIKALRKKATDKKARQRRRSRGESPGESPRTTTTTSTTTKGTGGTTSNQLELDPEYVIPAYGSTARLRPAAHAQGGKGNAPKAISQPCDAVCDRPAGAGGRSEPGRFRVAGRDQVGNRGARAPAAAAACRQHGHGPRGTGAGEGMGAKAAAGPAHAGAPGPAPGGRAEAAGRIAVAVPEAGGGGRVHPGGRQPRHPGPVDRDPGTLRPRSPGRDPASRPIAGRESRDPAGPGPGRHRTAGGGGPIPVAALAAATGPTVPRSGGRVAGPAGCAAGGRRAA